MPTDTSATNQALVVTIPATPAPALSPNARAHWRTKHREATELNSVARWSTVNTLAQRGMRGTWTGPITLHWIVAWGKGRKIMDQDNLIASLKHAQDGIAGAIGIDDKAFIVGSVSQDRDPDGIGFIRVALEQEVAE